MGDAVRAERLRVERGGRLGKTTLMRATVGVQIVSSDVGARLALDGTIVVGAALVALGLAVATLRRRTA